MKEMEPKLVLEANDYPLWSELVKVLAASSYGVDYVVDIFCERRDASGVYGVVWKKRLRLPMSLWLELVKELRAKNPAFETW